MARAVSPLPVGASWTCTQSGAGNDSRSTGAYEPALSSSVRSTLVWLSVTAVTLVGLLQLVAEKVNGPLVTAVPPVSLACTV